MTKEELIQRWVEIIRMKASQYEHPIYGKGGNVSSPDLDNIASEIEAFFIGLESK